MTKCPACGKEINYLSKWESVEGEYRLYPDGRLEQMTLSRDGKTNEYGCPKCQKVLFTNETDALEFLKEAEVSG